MIQVESSGFSITASRAHAGSHEITVTDANQPDRPVAHELRLQDAVARRKLVASLFGEFSSTDAAPLELLALLDDLALRVRDGEREPPALYNETELAGLPETSWLVRNLIPSVSNGILGGPHGTGKTFIAVDVAGCVASGRDWHGEAVTQGHVVYIAGEGYGGLRKRLAAWREYHGLTEPLARLLVLPRPLNLLRSSSGGRLVEAICRRWDARTVGSLLLIVDTYHRCIAGGKENDSDTVSSVFATLDTVREAFPGLATWLLHHPPKAGGLRGSSALGDDADGVFTTAKEPDSLTVTLRCEKMKDEREPAPKTLELVQVGPSLVITADTGSWTMTDRRSLSQGERKALQAVEDFANEGGLSWTRWHETSGVSKGALSEHRRRLLRLGYVRTTGTGRTTRYSVTGEGIAALVGPTGTGEFIGSV